MKNNSLKIVVLNDNAAGPKCGAEHGLSYVVYSDRTILFDAGPSDIFLRNAKILSVNIDEIDTVVLSHGHWDHGNGLVYISDKRLITHPEAFIKRYRSDGSYIGLPLTLEQAKKKFDLVLSDGPYKISDNIFFLGHIPRVNSWEAKSTNYLTDKGLPDFVPDDSAVVIKTPSGLVIVSGCAHSGICNIIDHAISVTGECDVYAVLGGFHLKQDDEKLAKTIDCLKNKKIKNIIPSHCTALPALSVFYKEFRFKQILSGSIIYL